MSAKPSWKNSLAVAALVAIASAPAAHAASVLSFTATPSPVTIGSTLALDVNIANVTDLYGYQFSVSFNPATLQAVTVTEGSFLATAGSTFFDGGTIDNVAGSISFSFNTLIGAVPGKSGSGTLERIVFQTSRLGSSPFAFSDVTFLDSALNTLDVQAAAGSVNVTPVPEPGTWVLLAGGLVAVLLGRRRTLR